MGDKVEAAIRMLEYLRSKGVTGPVSVWGVQCVLPLPEAKQTTAPLRHVDAGGGLMVDPDVFAHEGS